MYALLEIKSNIRVSPNLLGKELKDAIASAIQKDFIGYVGKEGLFLSVTKVLDIGEGTIIPGDGAIYYETQFETLIYKPVLQEVIEGIISEITEFGTFIRMGPVDGLVYISQVMDDYVSYSDSGALTGKESKKIMKPKDLVRARIIAISLKSLKGAKLGLTMRQPGLGKIEWIEAEKRKAEAAATEAAVEKVEKPKKKAAKKK